MTGYVITACVSLMIGATIGILTEAILISGDREDEMREQMMKEQEKRQQDEDE